LQHESTVAFYCRPFWQTEKHFFVFGSFALQIATEIAAVGNVAEKLIKKTDTEKLPQAAHLHTQ